MSEDVTPRLRQLIERLPSQRSFLGRPPLRPFKRTAAAFAGERACPPFRPSATACGSLAADGKGCIPQLSTHGVWWHARCQGWRHKAHYIRRDEGFGGECPEAVLLRAPDSTVDVARVVGRAVLTYLGGNRLGYVCHGC